MWFLIISVVMVVKNTININQMIGHKIKRRHV